MAPATRRSSGLGSHANSPSNLDHILEHFNQFKRKHITQNRDIIKTNALAQLRIKELEDKVLSMEAERASCRLDMIRMQSRLDRAESASRAVRRGWQLVGAGIAALSAVEGFDVLMRDENDGDERHVKQAQISAATALPAHLRPSARITLDPNALPGGVARNVARAPELGLDDLLEEEASTEMNGNSTVAVHTAVQEMDDEATREDGNDDDNDDEDEDDDDDVSHHGDGDTVSFSLGDEEETIRMNGGGDVSSHGMQEQQTPTITLASEGRSNDGPVTMDRRLNRMTSIDSLSSFADDEEIELSTDDDDEDESRTAALAMRSVDGPATSSASEQRRAQRDTFENGNASHARGSGRKRKTPSSPGDNPQQASYVTSTPDKEVRSRAGRRRGYDAGEDERDDEYEDDGALSASQSEDDTYCSSSRESRHSRRSSMRDRKSVNYALPKLNTKMRKPDPVDLVPAARGEARRRHVGASRGDSGRSVGDGGSSSSGTVHSDATMTLMTDEASASSTGNDGNHDDEHTDATGRRALKGKHEVASTGNLRDLRQKHQQQQERAARYEGVQIEEANVASDEAVSSSSREQSDTERRTADVQQESPRRRSSRKSLHKRGSSSSLPANERDENGSNGDEKRAVEQEQSVQSQSSDDRPYTLPGERVKVHADAKTLNGSSAVPSTPKWRAQNSTVSASRTLPSMAGTPIPRPTVRVGGGGAQGIKALSVAGRMQRAPTTSTTSNSMPPSQKVAKQQQQRAAIGVNGGKSMTVVANSAGSAANPANVLGSSARVNSMQPQQRSASAGHVQSTAPVSSNSGTASPNMAGSVGDPTKRNSLHAALTSNDAFASIAAGLAGVTTNGVHNNGSSASQSD